ncbi:DDE_3 domain-containing protein [Trichonephila clavipes]|nr:DDE_3 domain-containing protein [Trichonephila clavipes]
MDDNARPHHANTVSECLQSEDINRTDFPAVSPDLNPVEHVFDKFVDLWIRNYGEHCLISGVIFTKMRSII